MAVTDITIQYDNIVGECDLIACHSPVSFLINATYTGGYPEWLYAKVYDENDVLLATYKAYPYTDLTVNLRQFIFRADIIMRKFMSDFEDEFIDADILQYVTNITKKFKFKFLDQSQAVYDIAEIVACHGAQQVGNTEALTEVFNNEDQNYLAYKNMPFYVYFYNDDPNAILTLEPTMTEVTIQDYDLEDFEDYDGELFTMYIPI